MDIEILSLFPHYFDSPFEQSLLKKAQESGVLQIRQVDIRDFALDKHKKVDDRPYGGGPGMVLMPDPLVRAIRSVKKEGSHIVYLSPQGSILNAAKCRELSKKKHLILVCGHYEGIDERVKELEDGEEVSIGEFVLTSGLAPALVLVDAVSRFLPGVIGDERSASEDSFEGEGYLDTPHYTKPRVFEGKEVPDVLLSGNHEKITKWRDLERIKRTKEKRPDLFLQLLAKNSSKEENCFEPLEETQELHIVLPVEDVNKSARFFSKNLAWKIEFLDEREVVMKCGKNRIALKRGDRRGDTHILFTVSITDRNYFDRCALALKRSGRVIGKLEKISREITTLQNPAAAATNVSAEQIAFKDPDGYQWVLRWNPSFCEHS